METQQIKKPIDKEIIKAKIKEKEKSVLDKKTINK